MPVSGTARRVSSWSVGRTRRSRLGRAAPAWTAGCCLLIGLLLTAGATVAQAEAYGLDLATAAFVANFDDASYELCGEGDCGYDAAVCVRLGSAQVDCVVGYSEGGSPRRCGVVIRTMLRGSRLFHGHYGCSGKLQPLLADRFVRFDKDVPLTRFRAEIDWPASDEKNLYGVPQYDTRREIYRRRPAPHRHEPLGGNRAWPRSHLLRLHLARKAVQVGRQTLDT